LIGHGWALGRELEMSEEEGERPSSWHRHDRAPDGERPVGLVTSGPCDPICNADAAYSSKRVASSTTPDSWHTLSRALSSRRSIVLPPSRRPRTRRSTTMSLSAKTTYGTPRHFFELLRASVDYLCEGRRGGDAKIMTIGITERWDRASRPTSRPCGTPRVRVGRSDVRLMRGLDDPPAGGSRTTRAGRATARPPPPADVGRPRQGLSHTRRKLVTSEPDRPHLKWA